jgi:putative chitinase
MTEELAAELDRACERFKINTLLRGAAWVAQCGHEIGGFYARVENLNYSAASLQAVFKKYFPCPLRVESGQRA